jgi:hypothetical protein
MQLGGEGKGNIALRKSGERRFYRVARSPAVAIGRNRWHMVRRRKRRKQAKTVAVGCDQLPESFHGKEGVSGSSPEEGSAKAPQTGAFSFAGTCTISSVRWTWSHL